MTDQEKEIQEAADDTTGELWRNGVSPEGTDDTEAQAYKWVSPEGTDDTKDDAEGHGGKHR